MCGREGPGSGSGQQGCARYNSGFEEQGRRRNRAFGGSGACQNLVPANPPFGGFHSVRRNQDW